MTSEIHARIPFLQYYRGEMFGGHHGSIVLILVADFDTVGVLILVLILTLVGF